MWEESQAENTKLRLELSGVRSDLETARHQLEGAEKRVRVHLFFCHEMILKVDLIL